MSALRSRLTKKRTANKKTCKCFFCLSYCKPSRRSHRCSRGCRRTSRTAGCTRRGGCGRWTPPSCTSWHLWVAFFGSRKVQDRVFRRSGEGEGGTEREETHENQRNNKSELTTVALIGAVDAIHLAVTVPSLGDTSARGALELATGTLSCACISTTVGVRLASKFIEKLQIYSFDSNAIRLWLSIVIHRYTTLKIQFNIYANYWSMMNLVWHVFYSY